MVKRKPKRSWRNVIGNMCGLLFTRAGRAQIGGYVGFGLILIAVGGLVDRSIFSADEITPEAERFGWNEALAKQEAPQIAAEMPKFAITDENGDVVTGEGKNAELWKFAKIANDGKNIPTWRQESGDCVSMGWSNAIAYRMGFQIAKEQRNEILKIPFAPYMYGISRVQIGKRQLGRGAGSVGAWAAKGSQSYGVLPTEEANRLGFTYSGRLADQWGWSGPPKPTIDYASKFRIRTVSQVRTWADTRDALVHGYPVTVASNVGFQGGSVDRDSKRWLRARGSWGHQMCFIGVEDRPGREKGAYIINSWGADAHPKPLNDEPPGGFWVDSQTVERMVSQGDSWAYSDFDGFPASDTTGADWNAFKEEVEAEANGPDAELVARAEQPEAKPFMWEWRKMVPLSVCALLLIVGCGIFAGSMFEKYGLPKGSGTLGALLIAATFFGIGERLEAGHRKKLARMQAYQSQAGPCVNGRCPTTYVRPPGQVANPSAGLPAEMKPAPKVNQVEPVPADAEVAFNAFGPMPPVVESKPDHAWTAWPMDVKHLRSYRDCFEHEHEFVLVIGSETEALMALESTDKPVAFETAHASIKPGTWHVFDSGGHKMIEAIGQPPAMSSATVRIRRQR